MAYCIGLLNSQRVLEVKILIINLKDFLEKNTVKTNSYTNFYTGAAFLSMYNVENHKWVSEIFSWVQVQPVLYVFIWASSRKASAVSHFIIVWN